MGFGKLLHFELELANLVPNIQQLLCVSNAIPATFVEYFVEYIKPQIKRKR